MKTKRKGKSFALEAPIVIDFAEGDLVSQVVREVLSKDLIKIETSKK